MGRTGEEGPRATVRKWLPVRDGETVASPHGRRAGREKGKGQGREGHQGSCDLPGLDQEWLVVVQAVPTERGFPYSTRSLLSQSLPPGQGPQCSCANSGSVPGPAAQMTSANTQGSPGGGNRMNEPSLPVAETDAQRRKDRPRPGQSL